jgi:hypothetical protein
MTTTVLASLMMMAVLGTRSAPVSQSSTAAPDPAQYLTHKLATQVVNAVTSDDHRELAQRLRQEAQRNRQKEQYCLELSATYRRHPLRIDAVQNVSTADRYLRLADEARDAARADDQMATLQDNLAEGFMQAK